MSYYWNAKGVTVWLCPFLPICKDFLMDRGSNLNNCYHWVTLMVQDHLIELYAIYASNLNSKHRWLWVQMNSSLPTIDLQEYFNMVKCNCYHRDDVGHVISGTKQSWF